MKRIAIKRICLAILVMPLVFQESRGSFLFAQYDTSQLVESEDEFAPASNEFDQSSSGSIDTFSQGPSTYAPKQAQPALPPPLSGSESRRYDAGPRPSDGPGAGPAPDRRRPSPPALPGTPRQPPSGSPEPTPRPDYAEQGQPHGPVPATAPSVPASLRSVVDPNHPFYQLQMSSEPVDPHSIITGQPLTLAELLQNTTSPQLRGQLLHAYWELAGEIAKYKILYFKETQISSWVRIVLNNRETNSARTRLFQSAEKWANEERKTAELQVLIKQNELAALQDRQKGYGQVVFANEPQNRPLPIPCDFPLVVPYNTQANQMVQYRQLTTKALSLDKRLPLQQRLIVSKTGAVAAGEEYLNELCSSEAPTDMATTDALIFTLGQTVVLRCELVDEIVEYNREIADYVTETISPEISGRRLLAMLIQLNPADPNSDDSNETSQRSQPLGATAEIANHIPTVRPAESENDRPTVRPAEFADRRPTVETAELTNSPPTAEFDGVENEPIQQAGGRAEPPRNLPAAHFQPYHNDTESRFPVE